jgi:hypothetical protein
MNKKEAILFLKTYQEWIEDTFLLSPEGKHYNNQFKEAISALEKPTSKKVKDKI